jgi:hypothetical protein
MYGLSYLCHGLPCRRGTEVSIISSALRIASNKSGKYIKFNEFTIERQCDNVFIEGAAEEIRKNDVKLIQTNPVHGN